MRGTHPTTMSKISSTCIQPWEEQIPQPCWKGSALISDHGRNTSRNHVRMAQHLYLIMGGTHPATISKSLSTYIQPWEEHIPQPCWKGSTLISDHGRNTSHNHVRMAQHLYLIIGGNHLQPYWKGLALISNHGRNKSHNHVGKDKHLYLNMEGTHPATMSERLCTYI